jgi:hypothetical protein
MIRDSPLSAVNFAHTPLAELAKFIGIELEYVNAARKRVAIAPEVVRAALAAMNLQVGSDTDAQAQFAVALVAAAGFIFGGGRITRLGSVLLPLRSRKAVSYQVT